MKLKRLNLEVDQEIHKEIKMRAALRNVSIRVWVLRALQEQVKREKVYE